MKYKGILLDIDDTIYDYNKTHEFAFEKMISFYNTKFNIDREKIIELYNVARKKIHIELSETGSSHNRLLYIQRMSELLGINSLSNSLDAYDVYWDNFIHNIVIYDGVYDLLNRYKNRICFVTDLTAHIQHRKVKYLKLDDFSNLMVSSEEAGKEKPHPFIFMKALEKLKLNKNEVIMIGDSFRKDIEGALNLGIKSIWVNNKNKVEFYDINNVVEVKSFIEVLDIV